MNKKYLNNLKSRLDRKIERVVNNLDFIKDIQLLRNKWSILPDGLKTQSALENWYQTIYDVNMYDYWSDLSIIMHNHGINPSWKKSISRFVLLNDPKNLCLSSGVWVQHNVNLNTTQFGPISINVDEDATIDDVKAMWGLVETLQKNSPYKKQAKYQPLKNLVRDNRILELRRQGNSYAKISEKILTEYGEVLSDAYISSLLKRHKLRLSIKS